MIDPRYCMGSVPILSDRFIELGPVAGDT